MNKAWLIGVYTIDVDSRIEELGYTVSHVFATSEAIDSFQQPPDLIVFSDDGVESLRQMELCRHVFPSAIIMGIPATHDFLEDCLSYVERKSGEQSVARLLTQIYEREHRWDN